MLKCFYCAESGYHIRYLFIAPYTYCLCDTHKDNELSYYDIYNEKGERILNDNEPCKSLNIIAEES